MLLKLIKCLLNVIKTSLVNLLNVVIVFQVSLKELQNYERKVFLCPPQK